MDRSGNGFAPPMPFEQPRDRTFVDLVAYLSFKSAFDFIGRGNFSALRSREKGCQERLLFFPGHRLTTAPSFAWSLDRHHSQAIVAGNHPVNHRHRGAGMFGNLCRFSWLDQRIIENEPALSAQWMRVELQSRFEFFCRKMRCCSCDPGHVILLESVSLTCFPILSYFSLRSQLGITSPLV